MSPSEFKYQPFYCEENVWQLCQHEALKDRERQVVFISNRVKACPHWSQRASSNAATPVFWDYHSVLLVSAESGWEVWDLDCVAGMPLALPEYLARTFPGAKELRPAYLPSFRVFEAEEYLAGFSSDRSHMLNEEGKYSAQPPDWPPIGEGESNLSRHYDMAAKDGPQPLSLAAFIERFG